MAGLRRIRAFPDGFGVKRRTGGRRSGAGVRIRPLYPEKTSVRLALSPTSPLTLREIVMKAKIIITPKKAVVDPQGKAVQNALEQMGYNGISAVHVGKYLEIDLNASDTENARRQIDEACHKFLSNPVIEEYRLELE